ncbi:hypothetical protein F5Y11DRAFT_165026 [Daldinia sp. FL1419]|nr:hypothetical protein F5Y11DRAFT_165026 [Daldinia sp. FL1419]
MPKILLQIAGHDLIRDGRVILAYTLQDHGVDMKSEVHPGVSQSFWVFGYGFHRLQKPGLLRYLLIHPPSSLLSVPPSNALSCDRFTRSSILIRSSQRECPPPK